MLILPYISKCPSGFETEEGAFLSTDYEKETRADQRVVVSLLLTSPTAVHSWVCVFERSAANGFIVGCG